MYRSDFIPVLFIVLIAITIGGALAAAVEKIECSAYADGKGFASNYNFPSQCFVKIEGEWLTKEEYKFTLAAREGLLRND